MRPRLDLQAILEQIVGESKVYFQPPSSTRMIYPCIVYERVSASTKYADNNPYSFDLAYQLTLIDKNPDTILVNEIARLPKCRFDRHFVADNLNHEVFVIYF